MLHSMERITKGFKHLRKFGEIGIVTKGDKIKSKLVNRGEACIYLGRSGFGI